MGGKEEEGRKGLGGGRGGGLWPEDGERGHQGHGGIAGRKDGKEEIQD